MRFSLSHQLTLTIHVDERKCVETSEFSIKSALPQCPFRISTVNSPEHKMNFQVDVDTE